MKKEKLFWLVTAALAAVAALVPYVGDGFFAILSVPFTALGWVLRKLSLAGSVGNAVSILIYALVCAAPVGFWLRTKRRTEDALLLLLPLVLPVVLYYMVNPGLRPDLMQNRVGDAVYADSVWSIPLTWAVLKLLYSDEWGLGRNIYKGLRVFLLICAASCIVDCFGNTVAGIRNTLEMYWEVAGVLYYTGPDVVYLILSFLVAAVEKCFAALVLYRGAKLLSELERDPFGAVCVEEANKVGKTCREGLTVISLSVLFLNLTQILTAPMLKNITVSVNVPVMGLAVCFAMLAVSKLLVQGKELKDESDLFV